MLWEVVYSMRAKKTLLAAGLPACEPWKVLAVSAYSCISVPSCSRPWLRRFLASAGVVVGGSKEGGWGGGQGAERWAGVGSAAAERWAGYGRWRATPPACGSPATSTIV